MSIKKSTVIAILALFSLAPSQPADANDLVKFFQGLGVNLNGSQSQAASEHARRAQLESQLGLSAGRLSQDEARDMRWRAGNRFDEFHLAGVPSRPQARRDVGLDPAHTIRNWIRNLMGRIEQGRSDGRLTINESSLFIDQLNGIRANEKRMSTSNGLSRQEYGQLMNRISRIDNLISSSLSSRKFTGGSKANWY